MRNRESGPQIGQTVWWTGTPGTPVIPAIVTAVAGGVPTLTIIGGTTFTNQTGAQCDPSRQTANSWSWPNIITGI
jgi:hypothetical protein